MLPGVEKFLLTTILVIEFIEEHQDDLMKVVSEVISLDDVPDAFDRLLKPKDEIKILVEC